MALAGLLGLLLAALAIGVSTTAQRWLDHLDSTLAHAPRNVMDVSGRGSQGHPAACLLELFSIVTSASARVSSTPQHPDAPMPLTPKEQAPESGLGSVEADDQRNDLDDFAYHLRVFFQGAAQLNRVVEPGMSLGGRALSRLEDNRNDKPPRS